MAWKTIDRNVAPETGDAPVLSDAVREKIAVFLPRYETKQAALLPALHVVQDALGCVGWQAMAEIAELLELNPSDVFDAVTFYTYFWTHPRGEKTVTVCRSIACEVLGAGACSTSANGCWASGNTRRRLTVSSRCRPRNAWRCAITARACSSTRSVISGSSRKMCGGFWRTRKAIGSTFRGARCSTDRSDGSYELRNYECRVRCADH
jgi:hypothetical protein